jgi:uncharacterized protein (UPF0332 family)
MTANWVETTVDEMNRARKALKAAETLLDSELYEDAVSRAYYAVLHAAKAALARRQHGPKSHRGVKQVFGKLLVKNGPIEVEFARVFTEEQDCREFCDYKADFHMAENDARRKIEDAAKFVARIERYLKEQKNSK